MSKLTTKDYLIQETMLAEIGLLALRRFNAEAAWHIAFDKWDKEKNQLDTGFLEDTKAERLALEEAKKNLDKLIRSYIREMEGKL